MPKPLICQRFHSLQTGKRIPSSPKRRSPDRGVQAFPFPSNGKTHGKTDGQPKTRKEVAAFPFPSNRKVHGKTRELEASVTSVLKFPFPSNGNAHRKPAVFLYLIIPQFNQSFHSLQTGKHIASRRYDRCDSELCRVSIPFKRERLSQVSGACRGQDIFGRSVSIPFKRERLSQGRGAHSAPPSKMGFHSLQTGNRSTSAFVNGNLTATGSFHSLQTGKHIASPTFRYTGEFADEFPFPSNGKVEHKLRAIMILENMKNHPFPFPSNGNAERKHLRHTLPGGVVLCFHSLQTGKRIASEGDIDMNMIEVFVSIPFKRERASQARQVMLTTASLLSFHSLQTGTRIQSLSESGTSRLGGEVSIPFKRERGSKDGSAVTPVLQFQSFHSLQTGTRIASKLNSFVYGLVFGFPFPSNGNAHRKPKTFEFNVDVEVIKFPFPSNGKVDGK